MKYVVLLLFFWCCSSVSAEKLLYKIEAEDAIISPLAHISDCSTCSGGFRVDSIGWGERWVRFENIVVPKTGFYSVKLWIRNWAEKKTVAVLRVNNEEQSIFLFSPTRPADVSGEHVRVFLNAGSNVIVYGTDNGWADDLDFIEVYDFLVQPEAEYILKPMTPFMGVKSLRYFDGILFLSAGIFFGCLVLFILWNQRKDWAAHIPVIIVTIFLCMLSLFFQILDLIDDSLVGSILWQELRNSSTLFYILGTFLFTLRYTGNKVLLYSRFIRAWVGIIILLQLYLILMYLTKTGFSQSFYLSTREIWLELRNDSYGWVGNFRAAIQTLTGTMTLSILIIFYNRVSKIYHPQIIVITLSGGISYIIGGIFNPIFDGDKFHGVPIFLYSFTLTLFFLFIAALRFKFGILSPEIWGESTQLQTSAIIAVNQRGKIVESNDLAKNLFQVTTNEVLAENIKTNAERIDFDGRNYQKKVLTLPGNVGQVHVLNDITELHQTQVTLEMRNQELFTTNTELEKTQDSLKISNSELLEVNSQLEVLQQELREQAVRDKLTGLFNRRYLDDSLAKCLSQQQNFSIMLFDIDRFREFNSRFGFAGGDAVLKGVGHFLLARLPKEFMVCRYGGEEFCVLMPLAHDNGLAAARALQDSFAELAVEYANQTLRLTVSSSYASFEKHGVGLLLAADEGLRAAKHNGRNQLFEAVLQAPIWVRGWL